MSEGGGADREQLAREWREAGLQAGDLVLVHSSLRRTLRRLVRGGARPDPEIVLDSLLDAVGAEGTLLLPLFNFDFARGGKFDVRSTPSQMGALTEAARLRPGAVRTGHPIYSFAVLGAGRGAFEGLCNESAYGPDSPFARLRAEGGKLAVLDLPDGKSMTFYHHVEETCRAPWRWFKTFTGPYVGSDGVERLRSFRMYVRDLEAGVRTHVDPMGERLWDLGVWSGDRPGTGCGLRVAAASAVFDAVAPVILEGRAEGLLYRIEAP